MFRFHKAYFLLAILLFIIEALIAIYLNDPFIRPYFGDYLVVMLVYCSVKAFFDLPVVPLAIGVLIFAYVVEALQYFNLVERLGLGQSRLARVVLGSSFEWIDMLAYTLGVITIIIVEKLRSKKTQA